MIRTFLRLASFSVSAGVLFSCGGDRSEPRPTPGDANQDLGVDPFDCSAGDGYEFEVVQDFEKGLATHFYTNWDETEGGSVSPQPGAFDSPSSEPIEGGRCGVSERAFRMSGEGLRTWGMAFGWNFRGGTRDMSDWDGISFWARRGSDESGRSVFFSVLDPLTDKSGGQCEDESDVLEEKCDAYGTGLGLDEQWRFFAIPFSDFKQRGFGVPTDDLLTDEVVGFNWATGLGDWDVWVDDIALYRSKNAGAGGAGGADSGS